MVNQSLAAKSSMVISDLDHVQPPETVADGDTAEDRLIYVDNSRDRVSNPNRSSRINDSVKCPGGSIVTQAGSVAVINNDIIRSNLVDNPVLSGHSSVLAEETLDSWKINTDKAANDC